MTRVRFAATMASLPLLAGCVSTGGSESGAEEPPVDAPRHQMADTAGDGGVESEPIAELADRAWVREAAQQSGIPSRAVSAYAGASLRLAETHPECGIGWSALAGIGSVESGHGSHAGARVHADGTVEPAITGVPLDGRDGVMEVPDTDGGDIDGDEEWDRAVGPMQFLPETWQQHGQDADDDGQADPHHIDDAALSAGTYMCAVGGDLTTDAGWSEGIATYNQSVPYGREVTERADAYRI